MVEDYIKYHKQEPIKILDTEWFEVTRINYEYKRRKVFSCKGDTLTRNQHFPAEEMKKLDLNFNAYYIAAFTDVENNECIDYDFNVGFNRLGIGNELSLILDYLSESKEVYLLVSKKTQWNVQNSLEPIFDVKSENFIEKCFNVVYKNEEKGTEYIVKVADIQAAKCLSKYTKGYLLKEVEPVKIKQEVQLANIEDINSISVLVNIFEKVVFRTPLYANHNLTIYSKEILGKSLEDKLKEYANQMNIGYGSYA
jgi:hypothetical protein